MLVYQRVYQYQYIDVYIYILYIKDSLIPPTNHQPPGLFLTRCDVAPGGTPAFASGSGHPPPPQGPRGVNSGDFT